MTDHSGEGDDGLEGQNSVGFAIPVWFMRTIVGISGMFSLTFVPWSVWVTLTLIDFSNIKAIRGDTLAEHRTRITNLETSRENHALQLQAIASSRFTSDQAVALNNGTLAEIRALASEVKSLQRDFDRTLGRHKIGVVGE